MLQMLIRAHMPGVCVTVQRNVNQISWTNKVMSVKPFEWDRQVLYFSLLSSSSSTDAWLNAVTKCFLHHTPQYKFSFIFLSVLLGETVVMVKAVIVTGTAYILAVSVFCYSNEWGKKSRLNDKMETWYVWDVRGQGWWGQQKQIRSTKDGGMACWQVELLSESRGRYPHTFGLLHRIKEKWGFHPSSLVCQQMKRLTLSQQSLSVGDTVSLCAELQNLLLSCTGVCVWGGGGIPSLWGLSWVSSSGSYTIWLITHWGISLTNLFATRCSCVTWGSVWFLSGEPDGSASQVGTFLSVTVIFGFTLRPSPDAHAFIYRPDFGLFRPANQTLSGWFAL